MKKLLGIFFLLIISAFAREQNIGFLMNQKYVCLNEGLITKDSIAPIHSEEDVLRYPLRIKIDDNNILQTDGAQKNLKHIEKTVYENSDVKIELMVKDDIRYMVFIYKDYKNFPMLYRCMETDNWTIVK